MSPFQWGRPQIEETWVCPTCGLMVTEGHRCQYRETVQCPDCRSILEKGLEDRHFKYCPNRITREKAERAKASKEHRESMKAQGLVSYVRRLPAKEPMVFMEPYIDGHWEEIEVEKYPWKCKICGLVWQTRRQAENCPILVEFSFVKPKSPHAPIYQRMYGVRYVENGQPRGHIYTVDFKAMRKEAPEALPEGKKWNIPTTSEPTSQGSENPDPDVSELPETEDEDPGDT